MRTLSLISLLAASVPAASISFTGNFGQDDDVTLFTFTIANAQTVTLQTLGYAGGTNANGGSIAQGGFDSVVSVFAGTGASAAQIGINNDGGCGSVGTDSVTNACWDSFLVLNLLPAGTYTVALTQSDNSPNGPTLGDGFSRDGQGNFTGPAFLGSPGSFIDANPAQRNSAWALDILNVDSSVQVNNTAVPEPSTLGLLSVALLAVAGGRRPRKA